MINHKPKDMAPSLWVEILIFISSYYPLFLILMVNDIGEKTRGVSFGPVSWGSKVSWWALSLFLLSSVAVLVAGPLMRRLLKGQQGGTPIRIQEVCQVRGDMLNYTLPFLIGLFAFDYASIQSIFSLLIFLAFMFSFVHKERISLLNPMFLLMDIRLYNIKYKEIGRAPIKSENVLCLGKIEASNHNVEIKETTGIYFVFPCADSKE